MAKATKLRKFRFIVRIVGGASQFVTQEAYKQVEALALVRAEWSDCEVSPL